MRSAEKTSPKKWIRGILNIGKELKICVKVRELNQQLRNFCLRYQGLYILLSKQRNGSNDGGTDIDNSNCEVSTKCDTRRSGNQKVRDYFDKIFDNTFGNMPLKRAFIVGFWCVGGF
jgi:hypothetical protein